MLLANPGNEEKNGNAENTHSRGILPGWILNYIKLVMNSILEFKEGFQTVLKKRPHNERLCIILLIIAFLLEMFTNYQWGNLFMYYRLKLEFRMEDFSSLMSLAGMVGLSGQYIFVPLFIKVLKFHDAFISLLGNFQYHIY